jgi:hypothetical protein
LVLHGGFSISIVRLAIILYPLLAPGASYLLDFEPAQSRHLTNFAQPSLFVQNDVESETPEVEAESSQSDDIPQESGIPGAIVAFILGVFGLLVIARRDVR